MLFIIRHAESVENATKYTGFYQNPRPYDGETAHRISMDEVGLTERGIAQCGWLRGMLKPVLEGSPTVHTSEYLRARSTAAYSTNGWDNVMPAVTPSLNEQNYGDATYMTKEELFARYPDQKHVRQTQKHLWVPPGGISLADMIETQLKPYVDELLKNTCPKSDTILFTHLTVIMGLRAILEQRDIVDVIAEHKKDKVPNAGVYCYEVDGHSSTRLTELIQPLHL